ncbi:MAG: non-canonical purine NTP pyrophosphatase [Patulibacter sp.]
MPTLILATQNAHKVEEFTALLAPWTVIPLPDNVDLPPEVGETFAENALEKARTAAAATGRAAFADDSGIVADALDGRPGVRSARFAGDDASDEENLALFAEQVPAGSAIAYVCAIAYVDPRTRTEQIVEGRCTGTMAEGPRGDGGFGYDPIFIPDEQSASGGSARRTMAELTPAEKSAVSHRGHAARELRRALGLDDGA